jgi:hypothetical protein
MQYYNFVTKEYGLVVAQPTNTATKKRRRECRIWVENARSGVFVEGLL